MDALTPALKKIAQGFEYFGTGLNKVFKHTTILKTALVVLATIAAVAAICLLAPFAPAIAMFAGIAAAILL